MRLRVSPQSLSVGTKAVHILHFPIEDFECVDEPKHLVSIVEELVRRVRRGEVRVGACRRAQGCTVCRAAGAQAPPTTCSRDHTCRRVADCPTRPASCSSCGCGVTAARDPRSRLLPVDAVLHRLCSCTV